MSILWTMRRANGTGTTYLRPNGMWQARLTLGSSDGRQVRRSFYGRTRAEAEAKMEAARRDLDVGLILPGPRLTVARYLRDWLTVSETRVRPSTWTRYRQLVENNIIPAIGHVPLSKLTPEAVERMLTEAVGGGNDRGRTRGDLGGTRSRGAGVRVNGRQDHETESNVGRTHSGADARGGSRVLGPVRQSTAPLSRRTAHHMRAVLRTALRRAEKHGLVRSNAAELAEAPSVPKAERPILDPSQVRELLVAVKGDRLEALYWLAVATGLREGELLGLRWRDVDLGAMLDGLGKLRPDRESAQTLEIVSSAGADYEPPIGTIATLRVAGQLQRVHGTLTWLDYAKTERSIRHIGIPAAVLPVLRRHMASQSMERRVAMDAWAEGPTIYQPGQQGYPSNVGGTGQRTARPASISDLVFTRPTGEPLYGTLVHREWVKWRRELGVPQVRFHDLRHSAAALMMAQGIDLKTVQQVLGHASIRTTAETYGHVLPEAMRDAAQRVSEALAL